jgi:hypothetical protein
MIVQKMRISEEKKFNCRNVTDTIGSHIFVYLINRTLISVLTFVFSVHLHVEQTLFYV